MAELYKTKFITLKSTDIFGHDWFYTTRENAKNVVVILPLIKNENDEDEVLFLITKRPPLIAENKAQYCVETPAGLVGDERRDETIQEALKKELLEETGLVAKEFKIILDKISSSSGLTDESSVMAIAYIEDKEIKSTPISDNGVIQDRIYVKKSQIKEFLNECNKKGWAIGAQTLAALYCSDWE